MTARRSSPPRLTLLGLLTLAAAAGAQGTGEPADLILHRGRIVTLDDQDRRASAVVIRGGVYERAR